MEFLPDISKWIQALLRWGHVFFAIKDAIHSINNYNSKHIPILDSPATNEAILMSIKKLKKNNL